MERLYVILANILDIDVESITDSTSPGTVETWDSFNGLMIVSELEREFDVTFTMNEVMEVSCVGDIKNILKKYGIELYEN